jgi:hypothetical protein
VRRVILDEMHQRIPMSKPRESQLPDPDMQEAPRALLRAAQRAREVARRTGTGIVVFRDGVVQEISPDDDEDDSPAAPDSALESTK